jgi:hypothetical protein
MKLGLVIIWLHIISFPYLSTTCNSYRLISTTTRF